MASLNRIMSSTRESVSRCSCLIQSLITLARKAQNDLTWETVAAYLDEFTKVLTDVGKINNDRESQLTRLKSDLDAVRRVFGWED